MVPIPKDDRAGTAERVTTEEASQIAEDAGIGAETRTADLLGASGLVFMDA